MEHTYKECPEFKELNKGIAQCKLKEVMKATTAHLLPPKQRTVARFMNLSTTVKWAKEMLRIQRSFDSEEKRAYGFLKSHKPIINELICVFELINDLLRNLKQKGLSHTAIESCKDKIAQYKGRSYEKMGLLINKVKNYLETEKQKLPDSKMVWHISSDILESMFGLYKSRKASNTLYGITPFVLTLPLFTKTAPEKSVVNVNFKQVLESVLMRDLNQNLIENQVIRRRKMLNA